MVRKGHKVDKIRHMGLYMWHQNRRRCFSLCTCLHRPPLSELFSKQNFWYGSNPEKGKKQKQNVVLFLDLGTLLRVIVWYSMNLTLKIQLTKGVNRIGLCSTTFCKIIIVILNFLKNNIF